jgi:hypothetical protein
MRARSSRYSSPRRLAAAISSADPTARSYSSSPSSTQIVAWNDERALFGASQFQPPSSSCSPTRRCARISVRRPKWAPSASVPPLMHGSTSPSKNGFAPNSAQRSSQKPVRLSRRKPASRCTTANSTAASARSMPVAHNREQREEGRQPDGGLGPPPRAVRSLAGENFPAEPYARDVGAPRRSLPGTHP